ncbi:hypothetical protein FRC14_000735 [Serendipita sp. 396]|nr:hypothetical protein FRC14_000735 [Serendipita sp. 396]KAG8785495.1 hypothetical protein FRC15_001234 [Serendipita sp. 397]KAG8801388.1 hypothetical protein FRC16_000587 [Serendipita sp. 398]KAG8813912.1 hypothetical protein FRC19_002100 [Serendipita sp. 401]KAG8869451.1 hypothetical protein FRC20_001428 [Serendipita sp. 405]KAG9045144.1 hypothetical protein FS842_001249 [Serendipita sp. 407]
MATLMAEAYCDSTFLDPPPAFTASTSVVAEDGELPNYSRNAAADERILVSEPVARNPGSTLPSTSAVEYIFNSERLELDMGPKRFPVKVPSYGAGGVIEGRIRVKDFKAATKLTVKFDGTCNVNLMERGMAVYSLTKALVSKTEVLWTRPTENGTVQSEESNEFTFSFPIPTYIKDSNIPMPHSYATLHPGLNANVTYNLTVDLFRKGLRRHERIKTMILYLPRSTPPEAPLRPVSSYTAPPDSIEWETTQVPPRIIPVSGKEKRTSQQSVQPPAELVNLVLPLPKVYASAAPIPFHLTFAPDSSLLPHIFTNLSVHLIKTTIIRAGGFISIREGIIGTGELWRVEDEVTPPSSPTESEPSPCRKIYRGVLKSAREGGESSWNIPDYMEIRYSIRIRIRCPGHEEKTNTIPEYFLDHRIDMCTHNRIPDATDVQDPVIGLIAVAGSAGTPVVPASSLRTPTLR